jgi:hypothetical protein
VPGFKRFATVLRALVGVDAVTTPAKGRVRGAAANSVPARRVFVHQAFGSAARSKEDAGRTHEVSPLNPGVLIG